MLALVEGAAKADLCRGGLDLLDRHDRIAAFGQRRPGHDFYRLAGQQLTGKRIAGRGEAGDLQFVPDLLPGKGQGVAVHG